MKNSRRVERVNRPKQSKGPLFKVILKNFRNDIVTKRDYSWGILCKKILGFIQSAGINKILNALQWIESDNCSKSPKKWMNNLPFHPFSSPETFPFAGPHCVLYLFFVSVTERKWLEDDDWRIVVPLDRLCFSLLNMCLNMNIQSPGESCQCDEMVFLTFKCKSII